MGGAGAETVLLLAATVVGGVVAAVGLEDSDGSEVEEGFSTLEDGPALLLAVDDIAKEKGRLAIGASLAFGSSTLGPAV